MHSVVKVVVEIADGGCDGGVLARFVKVLGRCERRCGGRERGGKGVGDEKEENEEGEKGGTERDGHSGWLSVRPGVCGNVSESGGGGVERIYCVGVLRMHRDCDYKRGGAGAGAGVSQGFVDARATSSLKRTT